MQSCILRSSAAWLGRYSDGGFSAKRCGQMLAGRFRLYLVKYADIMWRLHLCHSHGGNSDNSVSQTCGHIRSGIQRIRAVCVLLFSNIATSHCQRAEYSSHYAMWRGCRRIHCTPLIRCRRSEWWVAELLFTMIVTVLLLYNNAFVLHAAGSASDSYLKDTWSDDSRPPPHMVTAICR